MFRKRFLLLLSGKSVKLFVEYIGVYLLQGTERLQLVGWKHMAFFFLTIIGKLAAETVSLLN
jgi:hypothetical protein